MMRKKDKKKGLARKKLSEIKIYLFFFVLILIAFGSSVSNNFAIDDNYYLGNPYIDQGIGATKKIFTTYTIQQDKERQLYRPIAAMSFAIEKSMFGTWSPQRAHLISLVLYFFIVALFYSVLKKLLDSKFQSVILLASVIFLLHPIHSEVVFNIKCRDELLAVFFGLLSLRVLLKDRNILDVIASLLFLLLAVLSKLTALSFLFVTPILLISAGMASKKWVLFYTTAMFLFLVGLRVEFSNRVIDRADRIRVVHYYENPLYVEKTTLFERIPIAISTTGAYLEKFLIPYPLASYYGYAEMKIDAWSDKSTIIGMILLLLLSYICFRYRKDTPILGASLIICLIALIPYSNLLISAPGIFAERFAFLASMAFSVFLAALIFHFYQYLVTKEGKSLELGFKSICVVLALSWVVWNNIRAAHWKDELTLLRQDVKYVPRSAKMHAMLANVLFRKIPKTQSSHVRNQEIDEAIAHYREAVSIYDGYAIAWNNLGTMLSGYKSDWQQARNAYEKAIAHDPEYTVAYFGLGYVYEQEKNFALALTYYQKALQIDPNYQPAKSRIQSIPK